MKTLVRKDSNVSIYLFNDDTYIAITATNVVVGNPARLIIDDCNQSNVHLFENVSNPEAWTGWKYLYTEADGWVLNPDWVSPTT